MLNFLYIRIENYLFNRAIVVLCQKNLFLNQIAHFIAFLANNTSFWAPNLTYGKPDTYDPLI